MVACGMVGDGMVGREDTEVDDDAEEPESKRSVVEDEADGDAWDVTEVTGRGGVAVWR